MKTINCIKNTSEIQLPDGWVESEKFASYGKVINRYEDDGKGSRYRLISKMEKTYSGFARVGRAFLGIITVISSLFFALFSETIRGLFTKGRQVNYYAVPISTKSRIFSQKKLNLSPEIEPLIRSMMGKIINRQEGEGISFYGKRHCNRIFELSSAPGIVFKATTRPIEIDASICQRYETIQKSQKVCREYGLEQVVIPNAAMLTIMHEGKQYAVLAEEKLDIDTEEYAQEKHYDEHADSLDEAVSQLAIFICKTGFSNVGWKNTPVINNSWEEGSRKIGLIDLNEMNGATIGLWGCMDPWRRGLVGCVNAKQAETIRKIARWNGVSTSEYFKSSKKRKEEIDHYQSLKRFYERNKVVNGNEAISLDVLDSLGIDLSEECEYSKLCTDKGTMRTVKVKVTLREAAEEIINSINEEIVRSKLSSVKGKRRVFLCMKRGQLERYAYMGLPKRTAFPNDLQKKQKWTRRIIDTLVSKGHIFELVHDDDDGYLIQL